MPKLKTRKAVASRITKTKKNKFKRRRTGQSHYNARATGKTTRRKRTDITMSKRNEKALNQALPYA